MRYVVIVMVLFSCVAFGAEIGDEGIGRAFTHSDKEWEKEIKGVLPPKFTSLGKMSLTKTSFAEIVKHYGSTRKYRFVEKEGGDDLLCYVMPAGHAVVFVSGALGGWSDVTAILIAGKDVYRNKHCSRTDRIGKSPEIGGLAPGLEKAGVEHLLGAPSYSDERFMAYRYFVERPSKKDPNIIEYQVISGVEIGISAKGKVSWFKVYSAKAY